MPSVLSAFAPPRHRDYAVIWTANAVSLVGTWMNETGASLLFTLAMAGFALAQTVAVAVLAELGFGAAWVASISMLNTSAQLAVPDWVRTHAMSLLLVTLFGSLALRSAL